MCADDVWRVGVLRINAERRRRWRWGQATAVVLLDGVTDITDSSGGSGGGGEAEEAEE